MHRLPVPIDMKQLKQHPRCPGDGIHLELGEIVSQTFLRPWQESLEHPERAQAELLSKLLSGYARTRYGSDHGARQDMGIEDYRRSFPPVTYPDLVPYFNQVRSGDYLAIIPEPPEVWVMTRGTTGAPKVIPVTRPHIRQIMTCGARALLNFAFRHQDARILDGAILNLNFPSVVDTMLVDGIKVSYGYSSGTYARLNPSLRQTSLLPMQEEIDALGPGITKRDWLARFELVHRRAKGQNVTGVMGVCPVITSFARYCKRKHRTYPKDLWQMRALFCTSVPKIHTRYEPTLKAQYGDAPVVEMYTATEGAFAQQLDELPYLSPNYDAYLFEVELGSDTVMLHEMKRGQWGRLLVSSCLFPRYRIGDLIECMGKHYFRVFGRDRVRTLLEHRLYRALTRWFI